MAMFDLDSRRPAEFEHFRRPVPAWFRSAKLGVFIHWGPYSVPAWAEPIGALGTIDRETWYRRNPYAEWYANTIRIEGSGAAAHHAEHYGDAPYDAFLDQWDARDFDAEQVLRTIARTGAGYFVPTTKHHDGVTLWQAPGTGDRNTVDRGPRRDLVREFADATRSAGLRFGVYYSGGLDWWRSDLPPITRDGMPRPNDPAYAEYAARQLDDLVTRYRPDILWGDIDWPDAGKHTGPDGLGEVFEHFYRTVPDGVVNDRWGDTHWDFRTSEYEHGREVEGGEMWENCRGIGFSFGHNREEDERHLLDGAGAARYLVDVASRGGNLLLNIGLEASGAIPPGQLATLQKLAAWRDRDGAEFFAASGPYPALPASDAPWVRWMLGARGPVAFVLDAGDVRLPGAAHLARVRARGADGRTIPTSADGDDLVVTIGAELGDGRPIAIVFEER